MAEQPNVVELILKIHAGLAKLVAPATPETLRATQPPPGRQRLLGGMPLIIKGTILVALVSLIGFLFTVPKPKDTKTEEATPTPTPTPAAKAPAKAKSTPVMKPAPAVSPQASPTEGQ